MAQVSVADVDNLQEAVVLLKQASSAAHSVFAEQSYALTQLVESALSESVDADKALQEVTEQVTLAERNLETARGELQSAQDELVAAEAELGVAEAALAAAKAEGYYDKEGNWVPRDTSAEEAAVQAAEDRVDGMTECVQRAEEVVEQAQTQLEQQRNILQKCQERSEFARETYSYAREEMESYLSVSRQRLNAVDLSVSEACSRLSAAQGALWSYLSQNPSAAQFEKWVHWKPATGQVVTPAEINARLNLSREQQSLYADYLYKRDAAFRSLINSYRERYDRAQGAAEKQAVLLQACRGGSGAFAEHLVAHALSPVGSIDTQGRTYFPDGRYTKTDLVVSDVNVPVILGRGSGMGAPVGGSIAIEVKTGHADYLYSQKDHMTFQSGGHQRASASVTVCSGDIHHLSEEKERELRDALHQAGSPLVGMLPLKDELDEAVCGFIVRDATDASSSADESVKDEPGRGEA